MDLRFPATQPDQTLCVENKRRIINEKHSAWMEQRGRALAAETDGHSVPALRGTLEDKAKRLALELGAPTAAVAGPTFEPSGAAGERAGAARAGSDMPSSSPPLLLPPPCASSSRGAAAQLECTAAYEAEKAQLARLPPARRRVALRRKRGEWLEQRRQEQQNDTEPSPVNRAGSSAVSAAAAEQCATAPLLSGANDVGWACAACTFIHRTSAGRSCEMCGTRRPAARDRDAPSPPFTARASRKASPRSNRSQVESPPRVTMEDAGGDELGEINSFLAAVELQLLEDEDYMYG